MSREQQHLADYLGHILEAIDRIRCYTAEMDEQAFLNDRLVQDAVVRNFEIMGEASRSIGRHFPEFAQAHPQLPLASAYQMRNALAHGYFRTDYQIVWRTIACDLTGLKAQVQALLSLLAGDCGT